MVRPILSHPIAPLALLVLQLVLLYAAQQRIHGFRPAHMPDTRSYLQSARSSTLEVALSDYRTTGYPLFLRLLGGGQVNTARVPAAHLTLYSLAILLFWLGLRRYTGSAWLAFAGATPLPYAWVVDLMPEIMTDVLAVTLTLVVVSVLLILATRPASPLLWAALAFSVFATYQVRPATVFLIAWAPLVAAVLRLCRERRAVPGLIRWLSGLALATILPYLLFAALRLVVVGHFGLVAFGGTNLAGVTACLLDDEVVEELPEEHRRRAGVMVRRRRARKFEPMTRDSDPFESFRQYSDNIWDVALPLVNAQLRQQRRLAKQGAVTPDPLQPRIRRNKILTELSRAIIRARPGLYLRWVRSSVFYGLRSLAERPWILWPFVLLGCSALYLALRRATGGGAGLQPPADRRLLGVLILGVSYFLIYLFLLSLVSWPSPRYASAMIVFLPSVLCMQLFALWRRILQPGAQASS